MNITLELTRAAQANESHAERLESETYLVRVIAADAQTGRDAPVETAVLDWVKLMPQLDALHDDCRNAKARKKVGKRLRKFLRGTDWNLQEQRIKHARTRPDEAIHVTVRSDAAELFLVPWELLDLKSLGLPLGALDQVVIGHAWPGTATVAAETEEPGRTLVAWSAAGGPVPSRGHLDAIALASAHQASFDPDRDVLAAVTPRALHDALSDRDLPPVTALHILCHGRADARGYRLAWNDATISPDDLATWLAPFARTLRIVTLCACETGDSVKGDRELGSMAQAIHRVGIPWVIGSRYPLSTAGSVVFTRAFYQHLLGPAHTIEQAFAHARRQLSFDTERRDHVSLQLYACSQYRGQPQFQLSTTPSPTEHPPNPPRTSQPRISDLALKLDRTHQWAHLRSLCETSEQSHYVVVFGDRSQSVNLFCERVQRLFNLDTPRLHQLHRLRFTDQDSTPTVIEDWDERLVDALPFGAMPAPDALRLATLNHPLLLILGDRPLRDLDLEQSQALAEFVGARLPALIADLPEHHHPVRTLIPIEQSETASGSHSPLISAMGDAAGQAHRVGMETSFVRLGFPEWADIEAFLRQVLPEDRRGSPAYRRLMTDSRRLFHDIAGRADGDRDFVELTNGLHDLLEIHDHAD